MQSGAFPRLLLPLLVLVSLVPAQAGSGRPVRDYRFAGDLQDSRSGPDLVSLGGMVDEGFSFEAGEGLELKKAGVKDHYAIELTFRLSTVEGYRKLVDLKKLTADTGLYVRDGGIVFYNRTEPAGTVTAGESVKVLLERDRRTKQVRGWVNQQLAFKFKDGQNLAVVSGNTLVFFKDDTTTNDEESGGVVTRIRVFNGPISGR